MLKQQFGINSIMYQITLFFILIFSFSSVSCELTIRVGSTYDWPPYIYKSGEKVVGLEVEILDTILSKTDFCREFVEMPSTSRAFEELKNKRVDLLIGATWHPNRALYATFSQTYRDERMVVFAQKKSPSLSFVLDSNINIYLETLNQENSIIAINQGSIYGHDFDVFLTRYKGAVVNTTLAKQRFDMLKKDRVNYAIEDELTGLSLLKNKYYSKYIENTKMVVNYDSIHYMLRPDLFSDTQLLQFNKAIDDSQVMIKIIIKKYTSNS
jgi:polar amino acid transport system substrate-binding protein